MGSKVQQPQRNGSVHVPAGTSVTASERADFGVSYSGHGASGPVEDGVGFEHCVHDDR